MLSVRDVGNGLIAIVDSIADRFARMIEQSVLNKNVVNLHSFTNLQVSEAKVGSHDLQRYREVGVQHLVIEPLLDRRAIGRDRTIDFEAVALHKGRYKKWKSLNVIPMR